MRCEWENGPYVLCSCWVLSDPSPHIHSPMSYLGSPGKQRPPFGLPPLWISMNPQRQEGTQGCGWCRLVEKLGVLWPAPVMGSVLGWLHEEEATLLPPTLRLYCGFLRVKDAPSLLNSSSGIPGIWQSVLTQTSMFVKKSISQPVFHGTVALHGIVLSETPPRRESSLLKR